VSEIEYQFPLKFPRRNAARISRCQYHREYYAQNIERRREQARRYKRARQRLAMRIARSPAADHPWRLRLAK
jgi:hypothetical protein